ncbi:MAG: hypothetical protein AAF658_21110 [Myxococcota bacterium]
MSMSGTGSLRETPLQQAIFGAIYQLRQSGQLGEIEASPRDLARPESASTRRRVARQATQMHSGGPVSDNQVLNYASDWMKRLGQ